ncbi:MAG: hypothetical protein E7487_10950 [Ruminococcaceae bacterium]|nr:hypothetical protein [Oscillospiraceae bacterium]
MDKNFLNLLMNKTQYPEEAKTELNRCFDLLSAGYASDFLALAAAFRDAEFCTDPVTEQLEFLAATSGVNKFTLWMLVLIHTAKKTHELYAQRGIDEQIFWDTFTDLRYKLFECKEIHDVWGTFVSSWYRTFFPCGIFKLGRLEFQDSEYHFDTPYTFGDIRLYKGCTQVIKAIHIPSAPESFDAAARLDSYKKAYEFFRPQLNGGPLVCTCGSWLLYPEYKKILPSTSNIVSFMGDFDIISVNDQEEFKDAWRLFGRGHTNSTAELPENTSMRRAFKQHLLNDGKVGTASGILIFDGEKIINI